MQLKISTSIAAGATTNVLAGQQYEFLPFNSQVAIAATGSAAGLVMQAYAGTSLLQQESPVNVEAAAGRGPLYPDDYTLRATIAGGTRMQCLVRNPTGGALTVTLVMAINPI